ncbi:MAG: preprotein translocase subunit SecG [Candidatus Nealsonbacteria bacterium RIFCSPHIGHO2_01_FULL_43_31]|uniref:Protein-export membrane protein SecG n=2 Tax=Candidatus Nealsoniibacteriota TaxID=1817911 RepID=A0A1G2E666_9BACT|nr:MAG: Preprotein translocase, SecG subunit [Parcubacteria group bacterium GW2011_GWB1_43_6]OGZ20131.1 MAG: preprotein translocase subunit SecG [Candidatus Nealsonbacteria bacterium RIFCSPHIGHO2_01_FULL_43_31]OGZ21209.1 MAG: preprotein translocase subunit SecG [Candidatus Nealsonbacteria bacterium RIFCSPHIGHO2_02_FULL_43_13]OGZ25368.1 MAG: preprotein translocase subunit SecG [Candidatus Nealsonbacteria bacterium RIFCSPLOWO2_01_FULL_43_36]
MTNILIWAQLVVSIVLIALILLQQRGTALGSAFGQESGFYGTLRGVQKKIFWATIVMGILFLGLAVTNLIL